MKKSRTRHRAALTTEHPESIAALASGMADDFNNILTTVMGACSLIDKDDPANAELLQYVALIRSSAERAADLSGKLMHAGSLPAEKAESRGHRQNSGSNGTSVRDKISNDDIVSSNNPSGGASS